MEDSDDDIIICERSRTEEEADFLYSITAEAWKETLKTPEFERSKHHPFGESVYVLPKNMLTKLDDRLCKWLSSSSVPLLKTMETMSWILQPVTLPVTSYFH
ncbi:unnamed protein product [Linum tenue]|uniref:Uncharacterized protein n=1 Tax=Linum tenue TaxID=586396 RepID=A0AAV0MEM4_9ROSI|nr:unnamed protein product [Linum tenue]